MVEKNLIVNNRIISYKGVFRVDEIFNTINKALTALGYKKQEKKTEESVSAGGKSTYIELRPFKNKTNYVKLMIKIKVIMDNVVEVNKKVDSTLKTFQQGDVNVIIDAWSMTDYAARWGMKPWVYFMKGLIRKYIYNPPMESGFIGEVQSDTDYITKQIKSLFSLYKYQVKS